jgi:hypothetical protein
MFEKEFKAFRNYDKRIACNEEENNFAEHEGSGNNICKSFLAGFRAGEKAERVLSFEEKELLIFCYNNLLYDYKSLKIKFNLSADFHKEKLEIFQKLLKRIVDEEIIFSSLDS